MAKTGNIIVNNINNIEKQILREIFLTNISTTSTQTEKVQKKSNYIKYFLIFYCLIISLQILIIMTMRGNCITEINQIEELKDFILFYTEFVIIECFTTFRFLAYMLYKLKGENV